MSRYLIQVAIVAVLAITALVYQEKWRREGILAGIDKQKAAEIAQANQNIAARRETDAHFNKLDAAAVCRDFGLEWVFADGKSECH